MAPTHGPTAAWGSARFALAEGTSLALAVSAKAPTGAFGLPAAEASTLALGGWTADTRTGSSVNCTTHTFCPHNAGTHTECAGHVTRERFLISDLCAAQPSWFFVAAVATVHPQRRAAVDDTYPSGAPEDLVLSAAALGAAIDAALERGAGAPAPTAVVVRTALEPAVARAGRDWTGTNPPYFTRDAAQALRRRGIDHLLVDLPSVDREDDGGWVCAHRVFFGIPEKAGLDEAADPVSPFALPPRSITELIDVPSAVPDGVYLLDLQLATVGADAAPSRPVVYPMLS